METEEEPQLTGSTGMWPSFLTSPADNEAEPTTSTTGRFPFLPREVFRAELPPVPGRSPSPVAPVLHGATDDSHRSFLTSTPVKRRDARHRASLFDPPRRRPDGSRSPSPIGRVPRARAPSPRTNLDPRRSALQRMMAAPQRLSSLLWDTSREDSLAHLSASVASAAVSPTPRLLDSGLFTDADLSTTRHSCRSPAKRMSRPRLASAALRDDSGLSLPAHDSGLTEDDLMCFSSPEKDDQVEGWIQSLVVFPAGRDNFDMIGEPGDVMQPTTDSGSAIGEDREDEYAEGDAVTVARGEDPPLAAHIQRVKPTRERPYKVFYPHLGTTDWVAASEIIQRGHPGRQSEQSPE